MAISLRVGQAYRDAGAQAVLRRPAGSGVAVDCDRCGIRPRSICANAVGNEWDAFVALARPRSYAARSPLFMEGDPADTVFNVTAGVVRMFRLSRGGQYQIVGFALAGDVIGSTEGANHTFSADAAGRVSVCSFSARSFWAFVDRHPSLLRGLYLAAVRRIDLAHDQMAMMGAESARQKLAQFLLALERRSRPLSRAGMVVPLPMTRRDIGNYLDLSLWTVSRLLNRFARQGLIEIAPRGVRILRPAALDAIVNEIASP
ncbi:MAG: Crp/Fnr family transcriptional regulator [Bauldia sp.]|nr:Crp/Fnr family transcriptional regulator [Bauldia sp.]